MSSNTLKYIHKFIPFIYIWVYMYIKCIGYQNTWRASSPGCYPTSNTVKTSHRPDTTWYHSCTSLNGCSLWQAADETQKPIEDIWQLWLQMLKRADPPVNAHSRVYSKHFLQSRLHSWWQVCWIWGIYVSPNIKVKVRHLPKSIWLHIHDIVSASNAWLAF